MTNLCSSLISEPGTVSLWTCGISISDQLKFVGCIKLSKSKQREEAVATEHWLQQRIERMDVEWKMRHSQSRIVDTGYSIVCLTCRSLYPAIDYALSESHDLYPRCSILEFQYNILCHDTIWPDGNNSTDKKIFHDISNQRWLADRLSSLLANSAACNRWRDLN